MEEQQLSFKDKYITPLTKEYKDFIHEMENTPSEIFYRDGERIFTEQERKFMQIYEQKQPKISAHYMMTKQENPMIGLLTNEVAGKSLADKNYLYLFNKDTKKAVELYIKNNPNLEPIKLTPQDNLALAERWQQEINNPTEMSKGMTIDQIAEKEANYHSLYNYGIKQTQNLQNMEAITPQEKVKEIFNEEQKFNKDDTIQREKSEIKLYENDWVILDEKDEFRKNSNGEIVIYGDKEEAETNKMKGDKVVNILDFEDEKQIDFLAELAESARAKHEINNQNLQNMNNTQEINKEKINSFVDDVIFIQKNETRQEHTERYTQKWNELNGDEKAYVKEKGADIAVSSIGEAYYEDTFMPREKENEIIADFNRKIEKLFTQEKVQELFNEVKETFSPIEKAFFQRKLENTTSIDGKELSDFLDYSGITPQEKEKVNSFFAEKISPILENQNSYIDWELLTKTEIDDDFRKEVNPIFLNVVTKKYNETKKEFDITEHLNNQMKYLGFGDNHKEEIQKGIVSDEKSFQIHTTSDRVMEGNQVDFAVNFNKSEKGGVFLNSFDARLITQDGEERSHNFKLNFTAKEAINLLEGRAVKTEFNNSKTNEPFESFVRLKFNEPKNEYDNYKLEFHKANEIDTAKIVELSGLKFEKPEYKDFVVKSLEKGNVTNVKFTHEGNEIEGKAVLNPQYKNLNLYDKDMNRLNTNKPLQGLEQDNSHEKNNVRQQNISRSI